jgi:hypothetical protein
MPSLARKILPFSMSSKVSVSVCYRSLYVGRNVGQGLLELIMGSCRHVVAKKPVLSIDASIPELGRLLPGPREQARADCNRLSAI